MSPSDETIESPALDSKTKKPRKRPHNEILSASTDDDDDDNDDLSPFVSHFLLFPLGHVFNREDMIALWIAEGLVGTPNGYSREAENVACKILRTLELKHVIAYTRIDSMNVLFKVNDSSSFPSCYRPALLNNCYATVSDGNFDPIPETILHLCIQRVSENQVNFEALRKFVHLRSLFIFTSCCPSVEEIPRDMFLWLKHLTSLNLSGSRVSFIPSSIGGLKSLIYLDLSYTPIQYLPETLCSLHNLQFLKLRCCSNLKALPKNMRKLTNLVHLDFDFLGALHSMPKGMGELTKLQTLSAFIVGKGCGNGILELRSMSNLTGSFCIFRLENVSFPVEAKLAALIEKKFLHKLELCWSNRRVGCYEQEEKILEQLQPPLGIRSLIVSCYCGSKLPSWISLPSYNSLSNLTLCSCSGCDSLPSLGELPSLRFLSIRKMNKLKRIDRRFCSKDCKTEKQAFPKLERLTIEFMLKLEEWTGIQDGDLPALKTLTVEHCPEVVSLSFLSCLNSLKCLTLNSCPNILALPNSGLPSSLKSLFMNDCPELKKRCRKDEGQDWGKMGHVPKIIIDYEKISWQVDTSSDDDL